MRIWVRDVIDADVLLFFEHQRDGDASEMAAFPSRTWEAHVAHWDKIRADDSVLKRTVMVDDDVAGNVVSWQADDHREVGYWIAKPFWGRGIATQALQTLLSIDPQRPLHAYVAERNFGSIRVLQKCGFEKIDTARQGDGVVHVVMMLR